MAISSINNFILYFSIVWGVNICLNLLYVLKKYFSVIKSLDRPIDCGLKYHKDRLIGDSTTFLGLLISFIISFILFKINFILALIPILVYLGHSLGSFIKRRMHKKGGEFVPFVDHGDYMITTSVIFLILGYINVSFAFWAITLTYILHPIACFVAFKLKLKEHPY